MTLTGSNGANVPLCAQNRSSTAQANNSHPSLATPAFVQSRVFHIPHHLSTDLSTAKRGAFGLRWGVRTGADLYTKRGSCPHFSGIYPRFRRFSPVREPGTSPPIFSRFDAISHRFHADTPPYPHLLWISVPDVHNPLCLKSSETPRLLRQHAILPQKSAWQA